MPPRKKYELTEEHRAQLGPWADRWIANALNCEPMNDDDRAAMRAAIRGMYEAAGLPAPRRVVFVPSPLVAALAGCFAAAIWNTRKNGDATDAATDAATRALARFMLQCCSGWYRMWNGGNQWSGWAAYLSFFRHVAEFNLAVYERWDHYEQAAIHGGPRVMHSEFCIVSDRPLFIHQDEQFRPHCDVGPFCEWSDGWKLWYIHGVPVTEQIVMAPHTLTAAEILAETNVEVRRVMIERFGHDRLIRDSSAELVSIDDFGKLWRLPIPDDEPLQLVEVVNSTPEPDGSFRNYVLRVPPSAGTAREAVAWTFDVDPGEYRVEIAT